MIRATMMATTMLCPMCGGQGRYTSARAISVVVSFWWGCFSVWFLCFLCNHHMLSCTLWGVVLAWVSFAFFATITCYLYTWIVGGVKCTSLSRPCVSADTTCFALRLHRSVHVVNRASQRFAVSLGVGTDAQRDRIAAALVTQQHNIFRWGQARQLPWPMCWQWSSPMYVHLGARNTPSRSPSTHLKHLKHLKQFSIGVVHAETLSGPHPATPLHVRRRHRP